MFVVWVVVHVIVCIALVLVVLLQSSKGEGLAGSAFGGSGIYSGPKECTVNFDGVISEQGEEADWLKMVEKGSIKQVRLKIPGRTITINGSYSQVSYELPVDDSIKFSLTFIGNVVK